MVWYGVAWPFVKIGKEEWRERRREEGWRKEGGKQGVEEGIRGWRWDGRERTKTFSIIMTI